MTSEGPLLETLLRRLVDTPPEFKEEPKTRTKGVVDVAAVVWDTLRMLDPYTIPTAALESYRVDDASFPKERNRLRLTLVACWLLTDDWFLGKPKLQSAIKSFLVLEMPKIENYFAVDRFLHDADRREEFARRMLDALSLRPSGESENQAKDRLQTLNSVMREKVLRDTAKAELRAKEIRDAMARKAAEDAASRYGE